jgi:hypothetical protein
LRFAFQPGEPAYQQLVSKPKLTAIVLLDRSSHRFLGVKFRNSRQG